MQKDSLAKKDPWKSILIVLIVVVGPGLILIGKNSGINFILSLGHTIIISGGLWLICRTYVKYLWGKFPWEESPYLHLILEVVGITVLTLGFGSILYFIEIKLGIFSREQQLGIQIFITLLITYLITGIHEMVYFYQQWIHNFSRSVKLERDNIEAKYETLKTQINPHFLFNSLNSLTSIVDDNPVAVNYIQNLSEFLRYMLGSRNKDLVYLRDELIVLNHYIELQKSRFMEHLKIEIDVPEKYHLYTLPPLALQMLLENCIKHNVISSEKPLLISITVLDDSIVIKNNLQRKSEVASTGQGLKNIIDRYGHFTRKQISIRETDSEYSISIPLLVLDL